MSKIRGKEASNWLRSALWQAFVLASMSSAAVGAAIASDDAPRLPDIKPARLETPRETIELTSECTDIVAGGCGRYLILSQPGERKLAVFDVSAAKIIKQIPLASANVEIAAGADCVIVAFRDQKLLQRWSLTSFEREATAPYPQGVDVHKMALGASSAGPVGVIASRLPHPHVGFLDADTLKMADYNIVRPKSTTIEGFEHVEMRASGGGDIFVCSRTSSGADGTALIGRLDGKTATFRTGETESALFATPNHNGRRVYVGPSVLSWYGNAWFTPADVMACTAFQEGRSMVLLPPWKTPPQLHWSALVPAVRGDWYLALPDASRPRVREQRKEGGDKAGGELDGVILFHASDTRPVATLPDVDLDVTADDIKFGGSRPRPRLDRRVWFIPEANLLVILARSNRELILHHVDVQQRAADSTLDFLVIDSEPPATVKPGEKLRHTMRVLTKPGGVKYRLLQGPEGMHVDAEGVLAWDVPAGAPPGTTDVIVSVTDAGEREAFQAFPLAVDLAEERTPAEAEAETDAAPDAADAQEHPPAAAPPDAFPLIEPPKFADKELTVEFNDAIADVVPGGAGRYLVLYFRGRSEVAVFDVSLAKTIYTIPVQDARVHIAAGLEKLVVVLAERRLAMRYDLASGRRESVVRLAGEMPIMKAAIGSASRGPLITGHFSLWLDYQGVVSYDLDTLQVLPSTGGGGELFGADHYVRAFRDGTMFGGADWGDSRRGVWVNIGRQWFELPQAWRPGQSPAGLTFDPLSPAQRVFFRQIYGQPTPSYRPKWTVLTERGPYYLTFDFAPRGGIQNLRLGLIGESQPVADLPGVSVPNNPLRPKDVRLVPSGHPSRQPAQQGSWEWQAAARLLPPDRRVHLIPEAKLLVTIPLPADRLVLRRVDVDEIIEQSPVDFLLVQSAPPREATRGTLFRYSVDVVSKRGGVKYNVDLGPEGMTVSPAGEVLWSVPLDSDGRKQQVVLSVRDAGEQERLQTFTLRLVDVEDTSAAAPDVVATKSRLWIDSTGKNRVRAVLLEVLPDDSIRLRKENGAVIVVPLAKLSDVDQEYVRQRSGQRED